ncbi:GNAT family N-acetyltransferase [Mariniluteicoccus flavus]
MADAAELAAVSAANRDFLAPWEPVRPDSWFTQEGQAAAIEGLLGLERMGLALPRVIVDDAGSIAGRITLNNVIRGAFRSCHLGYWVAEDANGRGFATEAVAELVTAAFTDLALHRVEASTLVHNTGSQTVLRRNGFTEIGPAPGYLEIAGEWQDHVMFQRLVD